MYDTLLIAFAVIAIFIFSVLFFPSVIILKHRVKIYSIIPVIGAILLIIFNKISFHDVITSFLENTSVNPIKILILFLSMTIFSLILEQTGFFAYISTRVLEISGNNQFFVFLSLYAVISVLTVFTSNDIIILTFTPFICHFCSSAKINPFPYLIMEFVAANTWSLLLIIGNPTNIYICGAFGIDFVNYLKVMFLPTTAVGAVSLTVMLIVFFKHLKKPMGKCHEEGKITDKPVMVISLIHLSTCIILLAISQYINVEMWIVSLSHALSELICVFICLSIRKKGYTVIGKGISGMPFEIIPFIVGMFIIVLALENSGITLAIEKALEPLSDIFTYGYISFFSANIVNNIPMSVLFSKILAAAPTTNIHGIYATVIGSNIGAFFTPIGALAGIMWSNMLKKNGIKISYLRFIKYGSLIGIPSISAALFALFLIL